MAHTIYAGKIAKRKNSTLQPTLTANFSVLLKTPTSLHAPTFTISAASFDYNYLKWDDRYYFVTDVTSRNNGLWEVSAVIDVLATFKADILASTQFVCYSSHNSSIWLADTRIPVLKQTITTAKAVVNPELSKLGNYVLAVNGQNGCELFKVTRANIAALLQNITQWQSDVTTDFLNGLIAPGGDIVQATENAYEVIARAGAFGNAFSEAPNCIRSCIWVPFGNGAFDVITNKEIYLGQFATGVYADAISAAPHATDYDLSIDWYYSDWRRSICEDLYIYLPLVGLVSIDNNNITDQTTLTIKYSLSPADGAVAYELVTGDQIIGAYGASCAANYPIGISQQASAGELITSFLSGGENIVNSAINSSISPISMTASGAGMALEGIKAAYDTTMIANSRHNSCIGGAGGGVGAGLDLVGQLYHVVHPTVINPSDMRITMGLPTMAPMSLSTLSGYCQCANAHVAASGAELQELNEIDAYLNSGFYIE